MSGAPGYLPEGYKKSRRKHVKRRDDDGGYAGFETEHWDGHQDATIAPRPVRIGFGVPGTDSRHDAAVAPRPAGAHGVSSRNRKRSER